MGISKDLGTLTVFSAAMVLVFTFAITSSQANPPDANGCHDHKPCEPGDTEPDGALCSDILAADPLATDGVYTIDPDGAGENAPFDAYCDMTTNGGGWTVVFQSTDPSIWRTNDGTPGTGEWSHNFYVKRFSMDEVLLHDIDGDRTQIVTGISSERLYGCSQGDSGLWWNGTLMDGDSAFHLGVHTGEQKISRTVMSSSVALPPPLAACMTDLVGDSAISRS